MTAVVDDALTLSLQRVLVSLVLSNVDNTVDIERNLLAIRAPVLIAKAVSEFAIVLRVKRVVAVRDTLLEGLVLANGVRDLGVQVCKLLLYPSAQKQFAFSQYGVVQHTQKSMSRFPALPNSLSPTWNVTVILSSRRSCSWKHSRPWAGSWMLWPSTAWNKLADSSSAAEERNCIFTTRK
jgi:hypothetical protein